MWTTATSVLLFGLLFGATLITASTIESRVVGGQDTTIEKHPHQLSLEYHNEHYCGAVLIRRNIALTGAYCFETPDSADFRTVYRLRTGTSFRNQGGKLASIQDVRIHPQWDSNTFDNDLAVVRMCDCLDYVPSFYRVDMAAANSIIPEGTIATLTGYGRLSYNGPWAPVLQSVDIPVVNRQRCIDAYSPLGATVTNSMFCAGSFTGEFDACGGDAGSPLVRNGELIGIVSWSYGCAEFGYPGVYTSISALRSWIDTQLY